MTATLKLNPYSPNFNNSNVVKRAVAALDWCDQFRIANREIRVSSTILREVFANKDRGLGKWLYSNLLRQVGTYQVGKHPYAYILNREGYEKVSRLIGRQIPSEAEVVTQRYAPVLAGEPLEYRDNGQRRFHPIQNVRREVRRRVFEGWWDYDIETCAPNLVYQYAAQHFRKFRWNDVVAEPFPAVLRLINDKVGVREHVATLTGLDIARSKDLLSMLFFRAVCSPVSISGVFSALGNDPVALYKFLADDFIQAFRSDVKRMWEYAVWRDRYERPHQLDFLRAATQPPKRKVAQRRMAIYLSLERKVMDAMLDRLMSDKVTHVLMHDGFMSQTKVDAGELETAVEEVTGYKIRLSETQLGFSVQNEENPDVEALMTGIDVEDEGESKSSCDTDEEAA